MPVTSYALQAFVSEPVKPVLDTVVLSPGTGVYASQWDKGELVVGQHSLLYRHGDGFRVHLDATLAVFVCDWCRQAAVLLEA